MNPRPIFRSMSFWLGIPGLLFLLWTWHDSLTHDAGLIRRVWISQPDRPRWMDEMIGYGPTGFRVIHHTVEPGPHASVLRQKIKLTRREITPGTLAEDSSPRLAWKAPQPGLEHARVYLTVMTIPHWLVLILYGAAWGGTMGWRQLRIHRAAKRDLTNA